MDNKIKILHMTPPIVTNGIYRYIFNVYEHIDKQKFQFDFLMSKPNELMKTPEWQKYHFNIRSFSTTQREDPQKFYQEIRSILADGYDILQLHTSFWRGFMIEEIAMEMKIKRVIVHSHSSDVDINGVEERRELKRKHEELKSLFRDTLATDFWACSQNAADWLYGPQIPKEKIKILPNAIELKKYEFSDKKRVEQRKKWNLGNAFVLGFVGRVEYQKNPFFIVEVFEKVIVNRPNSFLLMVGEGELYLDVRRLVREKGLEEKIIFTGWSNEIPDLLCAMDLCCVPSLFEGLGITVIEAQANGLKCLVSEMIPDEECISDYVKKLPLDCKQWTEEIGKFESNYKRIAPVEQMQIAGYEINAYVKTLERLYCQTAN